jgi:hypothetical protein
MAGYIDKTSIASSFFYDGFRLSLRHKGFYCRKTVFIHLGLEVSPFSATYSSWFQTGTSPGTATVLVGRHSYPHSGQVGME